MAGHNNFSVGFLDLISFMVFFVMFACGIWHIWQSITNCYGFLDFSRLIFEVLSVIYSLQCMISVFYNMDPYDVYFIYLYIAFMCYLFVVPFIVGNKDVGETLSRKSYLDYQLENYSYWYESKDWDKITRCFKKQRICDSLIVNGIETTREEFFQTHLSSIQSGCCKPSDDCNFEYVTPTQWTRTENSSLKNPDCNKWSNDPKTLCYNCDSCKAGLLVKIKLDSSWVETCNIAISKFFFFVVVLVHLVQVCSGRINNMNNANNREHQDQHLE